jgi:hypothetical protein
MINLCDCDIAINFGAVVGEVILVDYCAMIFVCSDCYLFCWKQRKRNRNSVAYSGTVQLLFKIDFLVELGLDLLFPEGKWRFEQD